MNIKHGNCHLNRLVLDKQVQDKTLTVLSQAVLSTYVKYLLYLLNIAVKHMLGMKHTKAYSKL